MIEIGLAFYIGDGSIFSNVIRTKQKKIDGLSKIKKDIPSWMASHVEVVFPGKFYIKHGDNDLIQNKRDYFPYCDWNNHSSFNDTLKKFGVSFSSSAQDGGTRFKIIEWKKKNWLRITIKVTEAQALAMLKYCEQENGKPYGWLNLILSQAFPFPINGKLSTNQFCSMVCTNALARGLLNDIEFKEIFFGYGKFMSPGRLLEFFI